MELVKKRPLLFIILLASLLYILAINSQFGSGDDAEYINLARSLVSGGGYRTTFAPGAPGGTQYPFIFPLLLSPLVYFFPKNILILKVVPLLCAIFSIYIFYLLFREFIPERLGLAVILLAAINSNILLSTNQILTEIPYLLFSLMALLFVNRFSKEESILNKNLILAILAMLLAYYIRSIGISLYLSAVIYLFFFKRDLKKGSVILLLFGLFILPWLYRSYTLGGGYAPHFLEKDIYALDAGRIGVLDFFRRIGGNAIRYAGKVIPDTLFYPLFSQMMPRTPIFFLKFAVGIGATVLILMGFFKKVSSKINVVDLYVVIYFLICLVWPAHGVRYLVPIIPFLVFYLLEGIESLTKRPEENIILKKGFVAILSLLILIQLFGAGYVIVQARTHYALPEEKSYWEACQWLKGNSSPQSIIMLPKAPRILYLRRSSGSALSLYQGYLSRNWCHVRKWGRLRHPGSSRSKD